MGTHVKAERRENTTSLRKAFCVRGLQPKPHKVMRDVGFFFLPCPSQHVVSNLQVISWSKLAAGAPTIISTFYKRKTEKARIMYCPAESLQVLFLEVPHDTSCHLTG